LFSALPKAEDSATAGGRAVDNFERLSNHEPRGALLFDRNLEHGAGQFERAADCRRLVVQSVRVSFLDVEVEARRPVVLQHHATTSVITGAFFLRGDA
jgi:hypothetical protein